VYSSDELILGKGRKREIGEFKMINQTVLRKGVT
jgi:hypothetical protein